MAEIMDYGYFFEHDVAIERIKWTGSQGIGLCPLPSHDDRRPSFSFNAETGLWTCFGCGEKGNAYQLVKILSIDEPHQYKDWPSYKNGHNGGIRSLKMGNTQEVQVDKMMEIEELKTKYSNNLNQEPLIHGGIEKYVGRDDNGRMTFHYRYGIKHHKGKNGESAHWNDVSQDKSCQIYMEDELSKFDKSKPLYIHEGEKDTLVSPFQGISFSHGAGTIPADISPLYDFNKIYIAYDNDDSGVKGAGKVANRIKKEALHIKVFICQWDDSLPQGYDVHDDYEKTLLSEFDKAILNAKEFTLPMQGYNVMSLENIKSNYTDTPKPIIENILVEKGVSLIAGTDGIGKTWFILQMAICIASGKKFLEFQVRQRPVLVIQFELSTEQLSERLRQLNCSNVPDSFLNFTVLSDEDRIFDSSWNKIEQTIKENNLTGGVVVIDNLYTSTSADVSDNRHLKPLLQKVDSIKNRTDNAFGLVGHHNKCNENDEPLLNKSLITGGKTLTNYVNNVFQIGNSSMGADLRRGKITKTRDSYTDLEGVTLRLSFDPETCTFTREGIIANETLHCKPLTKRWEFKVVVEFAEYQSNKKDLSFNRERLWQFLSTFDGWERTDANQKKVTRFLNKMIHFGFIIQKAYNTYELNYDEIKNLGTDK